MSKKISMSLPEGCGIAVASPGEFLFFSQNEHSEKYFNYFFSTIDSEAKKHGGRTGRSSLTSINRNSNFKLSVYEILEDLYKNDDLKNLASSNQTTKTYVTSSDPRSHILNHGSSIRNGLRTLIEDHERRNHNKPPELIDRETLSSLLELDREVAQLIEDSKSGTDITERASIVRSLTRRVFKFSQETGELFVAGLKPLVASVPAAWGTMVLLQAICAPSVYSVLGPGAALAVVAGHFGLKLQKTKE